MFVVITKSTCRFCDLAKELLTKVGENYVEVSIDHDIETFKRLLNAMGIITVPQIFFGTKHIGGYTELKQLLEKFNDDDGQLKLDV